MRIAFSRILKGQVKVFGFDCFSKKTLYFKRGKKIQTAMKKQKLFCTLRWEKFLSEKDGYCEGFGRDLEGKILRGKRGATFLSYSDFIF